MTVDVYVVSSTAANKAHGVTNSEAFLDLWI